MAIVTMVWHRGAAGDVMPNRGAGCANVCYSCAIVRLLPACPWWWGWLNSDRQPAPQHAGGGAQGWIRQGRFCRGGFSTRTYGRCLCRSPYHPREAVNEGHHPITPGVITDPANGISAAPAGVDTVFRW